MRILVLVTVCWLGLTACTPQRLESLAAYLDARQLTACLRGVGQYGTVGLSVLLATGGATVQDCAELRW